MFKFNKQSGQTARLLLVVAAIVLVAIVLAFLVMKMLEKPPKVETNEPEPGVALPVYEQRLGNIRFVFLSAIDLGRELKSENAVRKNYGSEKNLTTTEKFIQVTIGAQNKGTINIENGSWDIGNIVDSEGRNFVPLEEYAVGPWLPEKKTCGTLIKPEFEPIPCTKIYDVSKASTKLKIQVLTGENENSERDFSSDRVISALIDLIVK